MAEIKTLLFATDFSKGSARACELARSLANTCGASLTLLHVINEFSDRNARKLSAEVYERLAAEIEKHAVEDMETFRERYFKDMPVNTEIAVGKSHEEIIRQAKKIGADLILMGTQGRAGIEKMLMGSTAEKVVRSSPIPVLTVRE
ncbi:MAG: universal stress protein [Thiocapsa sp.]|uniref:universal stress protein n=1 Tax=Thiocapsa sp. TaxID=2024551 RepID=UPI001BCB34B1|nr:universal stress protein [Thiocapsa sp.]QVL49187.1 MAG: universal stress protein [Thiocapsa sp.]